MRTLAASESYFVYAGFFEMPTWLFVVIVSVTVAAAVFVWRRTRHKGPPPLPRR